jgi:hypothetical protein
MRCGGMSLGFQNAGIEILSAIDNWDKAVEIYNKNFSHKCYHYDISDEEGTIEIIKRYAPDMIIGGPPCQDFSSHKPLPFTSSQRVHSVAIPLIFSFELAFNIDSKCLDQVSFVLSSAKVAPNISVLLGSPVIKIGFDFTNISSATP